MFSVGRSSVNIRSYLLTSGVPFSFLWIFPYCRLLTPYCFLGFLPLRRSSMQSTMNGSSMTNSRINPNMAVNRITGSLKTVKYALDWVMLSLNFISRLFILVKSWLKVATLDVAFHCLNTWLLDIEYCLFKNENRTSNVEWKPPITKSRKNENLKSYEHFAFFGFRVFVIHFLGLCPSPCNLRPPASALWQG